jgi:dephospho-CoA kinase
MSETSNVRVLVCGGIGAGKSAVTNHFAAMGALTIEADRIGHEVLAPGGAAWSAVKDRWPSVVSPANEIDRAALAAIVFADASELAALESLTHPAISAEIENRAGAHKGPVVVEVPIVLPLEGAWTVVFVDASLDVRLDRAQARGMDRVDAMRRARQQPDHETWLAIADYVIENDSDLAALHNRATAVWDEIVANTP